MSQTIDEKVVELRFDNQQFESGVRESLSTLTKLKDAIKKNDGTKALDDLEKKANKIDLSQLSNNVEMLSKRFSTLGIVGMRVIQNITDGLMGGLSKGISTVTNKIVSGGIKRAMNIENARFQLQGIIDDEKEVTAIMDQAGESVNGTAYSYDVAAKAASMFAASGLKSGKQMENALKGIAGVAATTNQDYESIAQIFTTVAGNGRVMADQLNQLGFRGMNAAAAMTKFFNGVNDGSIEASENVASLIKQITGGRQIIEADFRDMVSKGKITFDLFAEGMGTLFGEHAKDANKTVTGSLANIFAALARTGEKFIAPLIQQEGPLVQFLNAIREKINEFNKALHVFDGISAQFTGWVNRILEGLTPLIKNFDIANTWIEKLADGTERLHTDAHHQIQEIGTGMREMVEGDFYTPFDAFYNLVMSAKYAFLLLGDVLKPIGAAFKEVFLTTENATGFYKFMEALPHFILGLRPYPSQIKAIQHAFTGLFKVIGSVFNLFGRLINVIKPNTIEIRDLSKGFFEFIDSIGQSLEEFSEFIDKSEMVQTAIENIGNAIKMAAGFIGTGFDTVYGAIKTFDPSKILKDINVAFANLGSTIAGALPDWIKPYLSKIADIFDTMAYDLSIFDLSAIQADFKSLGEVFEDFANTVLKLEDLKDKIVKFFDFSDAESGINKIIGKGNEFVDWFKGNIAPLFSNRDIVAYTGAGGFLWVFFQIGKMLSGISSILNGGGAVLMELPKTLKSVRKAVDAYTNEINIKNVEAMSKAILMIAGSIFVLSIIKPERLKPAAIAIGSMVAIIMGALTAMSFAPKTVTTAASALNNAVSQLGKALNNFVKGLKWSLILRSVGAMAIEFALSIGIIVGAIYLLSRMLDNDKTGNMKNAAAIVTVIGGAILTIILVFSLIGQKLKEGMLAFAAAGAGIFAMSLAILAVIGALNLIMSMKLPANYKDRLVLLRDVILGVMGLMVVFAIANRIADGFSSFKIGKGGLNYTKSGSLSALPLVSAIGMILACTYAIKELMAMDMPKNWRERARLLTDVFIGIMGILLVMGLASRIAGQGGGLKAVGTVIAICIFIGAALAALKALEDFQPKKLLKGVLALAGVLIALSIALAGASNIKGLGSAATVVAMCLMIGTIVGAISFLSLLPGPALLKGALALGSVLVVLAIAMAAASNISGDWKTVAAMIGAIVAIAGSLWFLADKNWIKLLAAAVSMGMVLLALSKVFKELGGVGEADPGDMLKVFAAGVASLVIIAALLNWLADKPWSGILAAGASIAAVLYTYGKVFGMIGEAEDIDIKKIGLFLLGSLAIAVIAGALWIAARFNWKQLLAAGGAIAGVLLALAGAIKIMSMVPTRPDQLGANVASLIVGALAAILIGFALSLCAQYDWKNLLGAAAAIGIVMLALAGTMAIITAVGSVAAAGVLVAIGTIIEALVLLAGVVFALMILQRYNPDKLIGAAIAIAITMLAIGICMAITTAVGAVAGVGVFAAAAMIAEAIVELHYVVEALERLSKCDPNRLTASVEAIVNTFKALEELMTVVTLVGLAAPFAVAGVLAMDALVVDLGLLLTGLHELADNDALKDGGDKLGSIGEGIGKFFGGIVEGIGESLISLLPSLGTNLSAFMTNAKGFFDGIKQITPDVATSAKTLTEVIGYVMGADFISTFTDFGMKPVNDLHNLVFGKDGGFAGTLKKLGEGLAGFAEATKDIKDPAAFKTVTEAMGYLIDMSKDLPNSGGALGAIFGDNDPDVWGDQIFKMGRAIKNLAICITGVDFSAIRPFAQALTPLINACNNIGNSGGAWGDFWGNNDPDEWGSMVYSMARSLKNLSIMITGVDWSGISPMANAMKILIDRCNEIANEGGVLAWWVGDNPPDQWGEEVYTMARYLKNIAIMVTGVDFSSLNPMATAMKNLIEATNNINPSSGMLGNVEYMGNWCDNLNKIGSTIYTFYLNTINIDPDKISQIGTALQEIMKALILISGGKVDGTKISNFAQSLENLATSGIDGFAQNITNGAEQVVTAVNSFIEVILAAIDAYTSKFQELGKTQAEAYLAGIRSMYAEAQTVGKMLGMKAYSGLELEVKNFEQIGVMCAKGFAKGLVNSEALAAIAKSAAAIGAKAKEATKKSVDSESPSKDFMKIGAFCGEGMAIGLYEWGDKVATAAGSLGESAKSGLQLALENLNKEADDILSDAPVITPMVDLTNVMSAAGQINSMFNSALYRTNSGTRNIASVMSGRVTQNGSEEFQNENGSRFGTHYTFVQNNNSPKALSRLDIYRDTKSLFKQYREAVEGV